MSASVATQFLECKLPKADGTLSDDYMITEHTIALFHLYVASYLDAGVTERLRKD